MILIDTNVLVYAHKSEAPRHREYHQWLVRTLESDQAYGISDLVLSSFVRIVTHPRVFTTPSPLAEALEFAVLVRSQPNAVLVAPGPRHWGIFISMCEQAAVRGNLVPDAFLAALAIESGSEWISTDRDFARFPGLKWRPPFS